MTTYQQSPWCGIYSISTSESSDRILLAPALCASGCVPSDISVTVAIANRLCAGNVKPFKIIIPDAAELQLEKDPPAAVV